MIREDHADAQRRACATVRGFWFVIRRRLGH
jgi:hypothetical protein